MPRRYLSVLLLALVAGGGRADDSKRIEEAERLLGELRTVLRGIKDGAAARGALPRLERLSKQLDEMRRSLQKREPDRKDAERLEKAGRGLDREVVRLDIDPKTPKAVRDLPLFRQFREGMVARVRIDVQALSNA